MCKTKMFKLFDTFTQNLKKNFHGGIFPPEMKIRSYKFPLRSPPLPTNFIVPLKQHLGPEGELRITPGDRVLKGQPLTFGQGRVVPIHAPTSGRVHAIKPHIIAHPSGLEELCVFIESDGEDQWCQREPVKNYDKLSAQELIHLIHQAGIAGLGGAGFPTASKLLSGISGIDTLILNAVECEPYITADDRLIQEHAEQIIEGINILRYLLRPKVTYIGIEDNKIEAIAALKQVLHSQSGIILQVIPTKYPSGAAKQLIKILTGEEVPHGKHSTSIGILIQNIGTAFAIKRAIVNGEPLIERVVTLTGNDISKPGNLLARIGTPVNHLLTFAGFEPKTQPMVVMGGPLMGFTLPNLNVPIVKISNCILAASLSEMSLDRTEDPCIRCGLCVDVCPVGLLPQQLYWFSRGKEHDKAKKYHLSDCIECGACAFVCPSNIPLVQYYRQEKAEIKAIDQETIRTTAAKANYNRKIARLENEKRLREQRYQKASIKIKYDADHALQFIASAQVKNNNTHATSTIIHSKHLNHDKITITACEASQQQQHTQGSMIKNQYTETVPTVTVGMQDKIESVLTPLRVLNPEESTMLQKAIRKISVSEAIARAKAKKVSLKTSPLKTNKE